MNEDDFPFELLAEAKRLASEYVSEQIKDDGEVASSFVRDFVTIVARHMHPENLKNPVQIALNVLTYVEVFKLCFPKAYDHTNRKYHALTALQKAFDS